MIDGLLRETKEHVLLPTACAVGKHVEPTTITLIGAGVGVMAGLAAWQGAPMIGLGLWAVNRVLDGLDGTVARLYGKQSDFGAYVDILGDFVVYTAIPFGLAMVTGGQTVLLSLIFLLGTFYVNCASWMYLSALLEKRKQGGQTRHEMTSVTMPTGLIEGSETLILYTLFFVLPNALPVLYVLMGTLTLIGVIQRVAWAERHLNE